MGDGGYDLGARAAQIRDDLLALQSATAADMAKIQLDDRALFLTRWRDLLLDLLDERGARESAAARAGARAGRALVGRAAADDVGYRIVRAFRLQVRKDVFDSLTAQARSAVSRRRSSRRRAQFEGAAVATRHAAAGASARSALRDAGRRRCSRSLDAALADAAAKSARSCALHVGRAEHAAACGIRCRRALPFAARWLDMPAQPMPGDAAMPRVQGAAFGASQRLVVSPGREAEGLFQMPGGPVDHPLSPFYGAGHEAWVRGEPQPLLPGDADSTATDAAQPSS